MSAKEVLTRMMFETACVLSPSMKKIMPLDSKPNLTIDAPTWKTTNATINAVTNSMLTCL